MRRLSLLVCLALVTPAVTAISAHDAAADFDPSGRNKKPKPKPGPAKPGPAKPGPAKPGPAKPDKPKPDKPDDEGKKGPSPEVLIQRYTTIVLSQPDQVFPIQRLAQVYRERDGNLKKLIEDFEKRAAASNAEAWAAKVALGGILKIDGRPEEAVKMLTAASTDKPKEPAPLLQLGALEMDRNNKAAARGHFEKVLPLLKASQDVENTNRTLLKLCLDLKDYPAAKKFHEALVKAAGGSLFVKGELGRELLARNVLDKAESEFRDVVKAASGDNRVLAPALRDLGSVLAKQKKMKEAMDTLKRALAIAGQGAGVRNEVLLIMTDAYRTEGKLTELITILEAEKPGDFQRLAALAALYEETGQVEKALATYRKALAVDGKNIDARVKVVHLLQTAGELEQAIKEYEALIKAAPNNPDYVFELCETLIQRGERQKALKLVMQLESRVAGDEDLLVTVADFYERVEEKEKALKVLQKLAGTGTDPRHLIDLGDRYFQAGDKKKALEVWARLKIVITNKAKAAVTLGEVYLDHDMPAEALASIKEAMAAEPQNLRYKKALAMALERVAAGTLGNATSRYDEALAVWEELLAGAGADKNLARESRQHIVSLWSLKKELPSRVAPLTLKFGATPPDLEAGRLLAEVQRKLQRHADAEVTLKKIVEKAPGDEESMLALERVLVQQKKQLEAIAILEKLVEANPNRAREYYQRMAQYAAELYRDDDAIKYAAKAVALSPNDPIGHQKLGEMYRRRQDTARAIAEFRVAIQQSNRLFPVYFDLAELLLSTGESDEADRLFRHVVRSSPDEELVTRAARQSMQINLGKGTLETLERELLPVAVGNPQKPMYRRLLVELYGAMTFPLVQKLRVAGPRTKEADAARAELAKIGTRAVKPLLDALADDREAQQKIAIEVLAHVDNKNAGAPLFNFATGQAEKGLRVRAMVACGALRDPLLLPKLEQILAPKDGKGAVLPNDALAIAAAWGVARMGDKKAEPLLTKLLGSSAPELRALAAMGLGLSKDKKHTASLVALLKSPEVGPLARAAAIYSLGELSALGSVDRAVLGAAAEAPEPALKRAALLALARSAGKDELTKTGGLGEVIANAAFGATSELREAAIDAAIIVSGVGYKRSREPLGVPDAGLTLDGVLETLGPDPATPEQRAAAFLALAPTLERAAVAAVATSPERGRAVADALLGREGKNAIAPFGQSTDKLEAATAKKVDDAVEKLAKAVTPSFVSIVRHPSIDVRSRAVEFLAKRSDASAQKAVIDALADPEEAVRRAALAALGPVASDATVGAVAKVAKGGATWSVRVRAAEALGRVGQAVGAGASQKLAVETLSGLARADEFALVREAALRALVTLAPAEGKALSTELEQKDPEDRVRKVAKELLAAR